MKDELEGIFDGLTIEDFMRPAFGELTLRHPQREGFDDFLRRHTNMLQLVQVASGGEFAGMAMLAKIGPEDTVEALYLPLDEETVGEFVQRLTGDAEQMGANGLFYVLCTKVQVTYELSNIVEKTDAAVSAMDGGEEALMWYCEHDGVRRIGAMILNEDGRIARTIETSQRASILENILPATD